ncbi:MAG TPA: hypothetical protein VE781_03955 [Kineosporiaceae bacterium]|nr:hypothetical protein [Kineosporiaceae bacterium]
MLDIPRSALLAVWGTAWLQGRAPAAGVLRAVTGDDEPHLVEAAEGLPAAADLPALLTAAKDAGVPALRVVLPVPGDPVGLPGPPAFNAAALEAGECVLAAGGAGWGAVPEVVEFGSEWEPGHQVTWQLLPVQAPRVAPVPALAEAERALKEGLLAATHALEGLDVAALGPAAAPRLQRLRHADVAAGTLPPGTPPRSVQVLATAGRLRAVLALAAEDDGAAVNAWEAGERLRTLRRLDGVCRQAVVAAVNAAAERLD